MSEKILNFCNISSDSVKKYEGIKKYIATGDIIDNKIVSYTEVDYNNKPSRANQNAQIGDVLFAKMKDTKKVISINEENANYIYSTGFYIIRPMENVLTDYLYWLFNSPKFNRDKDKYCKGATQKALNNDGLKKIEIKELPNIEEQKSIICKLNKISEIIERKKEQLVILDKLIKSQFAEMFDNIHSNKYNWKISCIDEFFEVKGGKRIPKGYSYSDRITNHPYLRATDMKNASISDNDIHYISEETYEKIKRYTVKGGDIYLTNVGVNLGMAGVVPLKYNGANLTENAVKLVPKTRDLNGVFLSFYINSEEAQKYINQRKKSVGVPKLAIFRIQTMPIIIPPIELQNKFAKIVEQIDKQKFEIENSLKEMQELYESLMEKYFG